MLGVFDETLIEEDYDDIEDKKFTTKATSGWLGITDKYWITAVVPENNRNFTSEFEFENRFKANFIITDPYESKPEQTISNDIKIFANPFSFIKTFNGTMVRPEFLTSLLSFFNSFLFNRSFL